MTGLSLATRRFLLGSALMGAAQSVPWTMIALYLDRLGYTKSEIGSVQSCDAWGKLAMALPAAFVLARRRTPPVLTASALVAGSAYCMLPWMPTHGLVMACNLLAGLAWSVHYVAIAPFLYRHSDARQQAGVFGLADAVHTAAAVLGAFLGGRGAAALTHYLGDETRALAWVVASGGMMALCAAIPYSRIPEGDPAPARALPLVPLVRAQRGLIARFGFPQLLIGLGASMSIPFLSLYFQDRFAVAPGGFANLQALAALLMTAGYLLTPLAVARLGYVKSIVGFELASMPFFVLLAFTTSLPLAIAGFLLRAGLMNSATPVLKNFAMRATPEGGRELQNGITSLANSLGWVIGPHIGGWVLDRSEDNYKWLMLTTVGIYLVAAMITGWLLAPLERGESLTASTPDRPAA
ncbi:MAG: MFS transporter [Planctomycetes bacterium]|nr:MFS transporter [Planctomycetota bacterium]